MDMQTVVLGTSGTTPQDVIDVARHGARVELSNEAVRALAAARDIVDALAAKPEPVYGVSTGFGALATRHISHELRAQLQRNIVRSHAAGMGPRVEREVVRALMFLRLKTVASGHTGVRPEVAQTMADVLNAGITPVVHEYGSLGCSGDLAPLSHCALALMGEGDAEGPDGVLKPAGELLAAAGIAPVELKEKEGLALLNGTDGMLGMLVMALADLDMLYKSADITAALSSKPSSAPRRSSNPSCTPSARTPARPPPPPTCWPCSRAPASRATPRPARPPRPGRLLGALRPAGRRRGPRHHGPRPARRRA